MRQTILAGASFAEASRVDRVRGVTKVAHPDRIVLQELVYPEPGISTETALYFRIEGEGGAETAPDTGFWLGPGAVLRLDTYFNAFDAGAWATACGLKTLAFQLEGEGQVRLGVVQSDFCAARLAGRVTSIKVAEAEADLCPRDGLEVDLSSHLRTGMPRVLHVEIEAGAGGARITGGRFISNDGPTEWPTLAISITTFRREAAVQATASRLATFLDGYEHGDRVWLQVVDNGQSAAIESRPHVRVFPNRNLGGAGGFARGLIEARAAGATHCLFMDDDATFHVENIRRTYAFLALALDPKTALAGAMITNSRKYEMFENGAVFAGVCVPLHKHTDLRIQDETFKMLFQATEALPDNAYGGWWYFAFPLKQVRYLPFPFFVRGDDSGFALANRFHIRTLNGVVSFQDAFNEKENPFISYLDARYYLVHHILFPGLDRGPLGNALVPLGLILRSIAKFHYEAAQAQIIAIRDVLRGPDFFRENADMVQRREEIEAFTRIETWRNIEARPTPLRRERPIADRLWAITLNGHLLPFFGRFGARRVIRLSMRGPLWPVLGAKEIVYVNRATGKGYKVTLDRKRGLVLLWQALLETRALFRAHKELAAAYRGRYGEITGEASWKTLLGIGRQG